ncbi:uncharacterized protein LOC109838074 isoform X4 [Asparagus officinalis]|uniref:uncharacterized protein LOC109838074 isoform X4 n=1 Tax=Asparagus officinalis TaxID=4686 RepID=UPI00098E56C1|nr:uncharacterized protein LOC109838074 isoform X4 [Asparagus officinalis]
MALPSGTFAALNRPAASSKMLAVENLRTFTASFKGNGYGRRSLLSLVLLSTASTTSNASDSRTTLLQAKEASSFSESLSKTPHSRDNPPHSRDTNFRITTR